MKELTITGRLGKDPELRVTPAGDEYVNFSVAISVGAKTNTRRDWINVTAAGKLGEIAQNFLKKGTQVLVKGFPSADMPYVNKENKAIVTEKLYANIIEFFGKKPEIEEDAVESMEKNQGNNSTDPLLSEKIPF